MRLISWNVNSRTKSLPEQVQALAAQRCDLLALQEVRLSTSSQFRAQLPGLGLSHIIDTFEFAPDRDVLRGPRRNGLLIASRWPISRIAAETTAIAWPERLLSAEIQSPTGKIELHTAHIPPGSSNGLVKVDVLEGVYSRLALMNMTPRILCGDFNTPKEEKPDGTVVTWHPRNLRWDASERAILQGLARFG